MSTGIEQAAAAFDNVISGKSPNSESATSERPTESMFDNLGQLETDEESPLRGGGDDIPVEGVDERRDDRGRFKGKAREEELDDRLVEDEEDHEGDGDDTDNEEDEVGEGDAQEDDDVFEVTVDGERVEVPLREALAGYIRTETFHRRLNQVNDAARVVSERAQEVNGLRNEYVDLIDKMKAGIEALIPNNVNWDELYAQDAKSARELETKYRGFQNLLSTLDQEKAAERKKQEDENSNQRRINVAAENERILRNNPTWRDPKVMARDQAMMAETGQRAGYSLEEIAGITDARQVTILLKAAKWDKLQGDRPKPIRKGVKPGQRGAVNGKSRSASKADKGAFKQLSRTGSVEDAAAVFSSIISNDRR